MRIGRLTIGFQQTSDREQYDLASWMGKHGYWRWIITWRRKTRDPLERQPLLPMFGVFRFLTQGPYGVPAGSASERAFLRAQRKEQGNG